MTRIFLMTLLLHICCFENAVAKKRKALQREFISYQSGFYSFVHTNRKTTGNIYEVNIQVLANGVLIDSVWFGATPVPCDLYEMKTLQRVTSPVNRGRYLIKANKDLYANFYRNIDSTFAYNHFVEPFPFKADLVIMYQYNGKRYYKSIKNIEQRPQKSMRE